MSLFGLQVCSFSAILVTYNSKILVCSASGLALALGLQLTVNYVRITVRDSVRGRDRVRIRDRRSEPDRRSEAINSGANSDRRSEPNTVLFNIQHSANLNTPLYINEWCYLAIAHEI